LAVRLERESRDRSRYSSSQSERAIDLNALGRRTRLRPRETATYAKRRLTSCSAECACARPVRAPDRHEVVRRVNVRDAHILPGGETMCLAPFRVAHDIAGPVLLGPLTVGAGDILRGNQDPHVVLAAARQSSPDESRASSGRF
jgi:hypothetical protein